MQQQLQNIELADLKQFTETKIAEADRAAQRDLNARKETNRKDLEDFDRRLKERERAKKDVRARRSRFTEDLLLGAGFPLLFGGGPGAVLGGVGGAVLGGGKGGFGTQIFGSAIGQQLDAIAQDALNTATALTSTAGALAFVRKKSLFSSDAIKEQAVVLEEQGDVAGLAALLTDQLAQKIGNEGVQSLVTLGQTTNETTRLWNEPTLQLQALVSGPLNSFLKIINSVLNTATVGLQREAFFESLGKDEEAARARFKELTGESLGTGRSKQKLTERLDKQNLTQADALAQLRKEYAVPTGPIIPQTLQDFRDIKAPKDTAGDKAKREQQRLEERIRKLQLEREQIARITEFKDRIALAEADSDKLTARRIQGEQRVFEIQQEQLEKLIGVTNERERSEIKLLTEAKILAANRDTARDMENIQRQTNKQFTNTIEKLQLQLEIATATTREEAEQLRIRLEMQNLQDSGFSEDQLARIEKAKQALNKAQQPLNTFITDSTRSLNDLEQVAVNVFHKVSATRSAAHLKRVFPNSSKEAQPSKKCSPTYLRASVKCWSKKAPR